MLILVIMQRGKQMMTTLGIRWQICVGLNVLQIYTSTNVYYQYLHMIYSYYLWYVCIYIYIYIYIHRLEKLIAYILLFLVIQVHFRVQKVPYLMTTIMAICWLVIPKDYPPDIDYLNNGPHIRYVRLRVAYAPGMPGSLTSGFLSSQWWGKRSQHSRRIHNPQIYVSGKRPMAGLSWRNSGRGGTGS